MTITITDEGPCRAVSVFQKDPGVLDLLFSPFSCDTTVHRLMSNCMRIAERLKPQRSPKRVSSRFPPVSADVHNCSVASLRKYLRSLSSGSLQEQSPLSRNTSTLIHALIRQMPDPVIVGVDHPTSFITSPGTNHFRLLPGDHTVETPLGEVFPVRTLRR